MFGAEELPYWANPGTLAYEFWKEVSDPERARWHPDTGYLSPRFRAYDYDPMTGRENY